MTYGGRGSRCILRVFIKDVAFLRSLMLMCLYNLSINQRGLELVASAPGIVTVLAQQLHRGE